MHARAKDNCVRDKQADVGSALESSLSVWEVSVSPESLVLGPLVLALMGFKARKLSLLANLTKFLVLITMKTAPCSPRDPGKKVRAFANVFG